MKCFSCGTEVSFGQKRCPSCGLVQPTAAIPNIPRPGGRGRGAFGDIERMVSRSKIPIWVWIVIALVVVMFVVCACIAVGIYFYTTGNLPSDLPFS